MSKAPSKTPLSPLHTHTNYSVLDGASSIDDYIKWCKDNGATGLGVTDHGWVIGALELYNKCKKAGVTPLPGCEFYLSPASDHKFEKKKYDYYHVTVWATSQVGYRNLIKLASIAWNQDQIPGWYKDKKKDEWAFGEVKRVTSKFGGMQLKPRITFDELLNNNEGLVIGTGCLIGSLSKCFLNGEFKEAEKNLMRLLEVFKGRCFAEIMPHSCTHDYSRKNKAFEPNECTDFSPDGNLQKACNEEVIKLARKHDIPLLMTIDSHFTEPHLHKIQSILLSNGDPDGWRFHQSYHMVTTDQAWDMWKKMHGDDSEQRKIFQEAADNNDVLVSMAKGISVEDDYQQPEPSFPIEIKERNLSPSDARKALILQKIEEHGRMRWNNEEWVKRLMYEMSVICDNGTLDFSDYFIFLEKIYSWSRKNSIFAGPGRGSGAGSLLCYLLKITSIDPFRFKLPFERFLSLARITRGKWPDIDCDFGDRDLLVSYLKAEYGDKVAQCSTLGTLKVKSAIKDVCRAIMGWNAEDERVKKVTSSIPNEPVGVSSRDFLLGYTADGQVYDGHIVENPTLDKFFKDYPKVQQSVMELLGVPRSVGRHASAIFVSHKPIWESVPTCNINGHVCTQYQTTASNNMAEKAGLIKFDFLTVKTLKDIASAARLIQAKYGYKTWEEKLIFGEEEYTVLKGELPIDNIPMSDGTILDLYDLPEDSGVFDDLCRGRTESVFQMNSSLMTGQIKQIQPSKIQHTSDIVALVRPGPLLADTGVEIKDWSNTNLAKTWPDGSEKKTYTMTELYIEVKAGRCKPTYAHPGMEPILSETYGCAAYQEQLQQMFVDLAGYTLEEADYLRETLAKKKRQDMEKAIPELRDKLKERGWSDSQIEVFVSLCIASSSYSFNKAHSASYGIVAYQCAFLKHHFPIEWWTAVLQNASVDDIKEKGYADVLLKDGILELPSVNGPTNTFKPLNGRVYSPLYLIDRIGGTACQEIQRIRDEGGDYTSFQDFFERACHGSVNETVVTNLIISDAFKAIEPEASIRDLFHQYYYFKKVSSLVLGKHKIQIGIDDNGKAIYETKPKRGKDLRDAVEEYKLKEKIGGSKLDIPEYDHLNMEITKARILPIYQLDVHRKFSKMFEGLGMMYHDDRATFWSNGTSVRTFRNLKDLKGGLSGNWNEKYIWAGIIVNTETFQYTDKRKKQKVTALKIYVSNAGDTLECIMWPDTYELLKDPDPSKIGMFLGGIKESQRDPGQYSLTVDAVLYLEVKPTKTSVQQ
jgi:DNA polymerase III subunit alpha